MRRRNARHGTSRLTLDEAREAIAEHIPWLRTETADDLVQYIERFRDYSQHHGRLPEWWERRVV